MAFTTDSENTSPNLKSSDPKDLLWHQEHRTCKKEALPTAELFFYSFWKNSLIAAVSFYDAFLLQKTHCYFKIVTHFSINHLFSHSTILSY